MYQKRYITARGKWASIAFFLLCARRVQSTLLRWSTTAIQAQPLSGSLTFCGLMRLLEPHTGAAAVLVDEFGIVPES
jgi:hypothetical protein